MFSYACSSEQLVEGLMDSEEFGWCNKLRFMSAAHLEKFYDNNFLALRNEGIGTKVIGNTIYLIWQKQKTKGEIK